MALLLLCFFYGCTLSFVFCNRPVLFFVLRFCFLLSLDFLSSILKFHVCLASALPLVLRPNGSLLFNMAGSMAALSVGDKA